MASANLFTCAGPCAATTPCSAKVTAQCKIDQLRSAAGREGHRVRNSIARACCASALHGYRKRIVGFREAASTMASASAAIILLPLHERPYVDRGNEPHHVPDPFNLTPPSVSGRAGFHCHDARWLRCEKRQKALPGQLLSKEYRAVRRGAVQLKDPASRRSTPIIAT